MDILKLLELVKITPRYFISLTHGNKTPEEEQIFAQVTSLREPILMQEDFFDDNVLGNYSNNIIIIIIIIIIITS